MVKSGMWRVERIKERFSLAFYAPFVMIIVALLAGAMFGLFGPTILTLVGWGLLLGVLVTVVPRYRV